MEMERKRQTKQNEKINSNNFCVSPPVRLAGNFIFRFGHMVKCLAFVQFHGSGSL